MGLVVFFPYNNIQIIPILKLKEDMFTRNSKDNFKLLDDILNTYVGEKFESIATNYSEFIDSKLFYNFHVRHKSMNYLRAFQQNNTNKNYNYYEKYRKIQHKLVYHYTENKKCKDEYHNAQIKEVFRSILFKVVSQDLIGNNRNKKKILKVLHNFLKTAKTEPFSLRNLVHEINVLSIPWILPGASQNIKFILIAKFLKWLFQYFIVVIFCQFHITYFKEERIFILMDKWIKQKKEYLKKMNNKMVLEPVIHVNNVDSVYKKLFIIPKHRGYRLIIKAKYTKEQIQEWKKILSILKYLHETDLKNRNSFFSESFIKIIKENNNSKDKIFLVSADIFDAYGSIRPAKLFDIIITLFEKLENKLLLQRYTIQNSEKFRVVGTNKHLLESLTMHSCEIIEKSSVLQKLKEYIFNTKATINNKVYNLCKGVPQGLILSATLCDIYYAHMRKKYFINFENYGSICTYVDDIIYITKNVEQANLYQNLLKKGIPEYNCWFHKIKLIGDIFNTSNTNDTNDVDYLGWKINSNSLEIEPKYSIARYSITYTLLSHLTLKQKLQNLSSLKLNKLLMCKEVNKQAKIFYNMEVIALQHARRCFALLSSTNVKEKLVIKIIHKTNYRIIQNIEKLAKWDKFEKEENINYLKYIIWKSFHVIFNKKKNSFLALIKEFQKMSRRYSKANKSKE